MPLRIAVLEGNNGVFTVKAFTAKFWETGQHEIRERVIPPWWSERLLYRGLKNGRIGQCMGSWWKVDPYRKGDVPPGKSGV